MKLKNNDAKSVSASKLLGPALVYIALTCFAGFILVSVWNLFVSNPTVTSLETSAFPIANIPFPAVAVCNVNKISRRRATSLAEYISNKTGEDLETIMGYVKFLGFLFDADYDDDFNEKFEDFQTILDDLQLEIRSLMRNLATPCEDLLHSCRWKGVQVNCSSIFYLRLTYEGDCCTFNYVKSTPYSVNSPGNSTLEVGAAGINGGLSLTIDNDPEDYFYTTLSTTGVKILIFTPTDYPDKSSGHLIASVLDIGSENFLQVIPTAEIAVADVMQYGVDKRNCLFEAEQETQFGVYSQSDCFVDCRVRSMLALCGCIPFTIPRVRKEIDTCTLSDLSCLSKYQSQMAKWTSLVPDGLNIKLLLKEQEEGLYCPDKCYPACEDISYDVIPSSVHLFKPGNHTYVHIYYPRRFLNLFKQDVERYWFDIMSSIGGIFGLVLGFSIVSIVEGIIFCAKFVAVRW